MDEILYEILFAILFEILYEILFGILYEIFFEILYEILHEKLIYVWKISAVYVQEAAVAAPWRRQGYQGGATSETLESSKSRFLFFSLSISSATHWR